MCRPLKELRSKFLAFLRKRPQVAFEEGETPSISAPASDCGSAFEVLVPGQASEKLCTRSLLEETLPTNYDVSCGNRR